MAVVTRYFSTSSAGAADGTTWDDRAALFSAGNWSSVITGFNFSGTDSLRAYIGPGSYTCSQSLASGLFTNAPTSANPLILQGCDGSGVALTVPDPDWTSDQPAWDDSTLPVIASTTNVITVNLAWCGLILIKFTASGRNGSVISTFMGMEWCVVTNSTANTSATALTFNATSSGHIYGSVLSCTGSSYDTVVSTGTYEPIDNTRIVGVTGSSGNRRGLTLTANSVTLHRCTVVSNGGEGVISTSTGTSQSTRLYRCVVANNGDAGVKANSTASQVDLFDVRSCMVTGNGAAGVDGNSAAGRMLVTHSRLRDNTSGNFAGMGNWPDDLLNYTTDAADADDYVDAPGGDFRIKIGSLIWGQGFGVSDQPAGVALLAGRGLGLIGGA